MTGGRLGRSPGFWARRGLCVGIVIFVICTIGALGTGLGARVRTGISGQPGGDREQGRFGNPTVTFRHNHVIGRTNRADRAGRWGSEGDRPNPLKPCADQMGFPTLGIQQGAPGQALLVRVVGPPALGDPKGHGREKLAGGGFRQNQQAMVAQQQLRPAQGGIHIRRGMEHIGRQDHIETPRGESLGDRVLFNVQGLELAAAIVTQAIGGSAHQGRRNIGENIAELRVILQGRQNDGGRGSRACSNFQNPQGAIGAPFRLPGRQHRHHRGIHALGQRPTGIDRSHQLTGTLGKQNFMARHFPPPQPGILRHTGG